MVLPFLGKLSGEAVRNMARNLFSGFYENKLTANQALKSLQAAGLGYARQEFLADYRAKRPGYDKATSAGKIGKEAIPSEGLLKSQYYGNPAKYSFVFKATGTDLETGESTEQYFAYHRNSLDTRANLESDALEWMQEQADKYGFEIEDITLKEGYINPIYVTPPPH